MHLPKQGTRTKPPFCVQCANSPCVADGCRGGVDPTFIIRQLARNVLLVRGDVATHGVVTRRDCRCDQRCYVSVMCSDMRVPSIRELFGAVGVDGLIAM